MKHADNDAPTVDTTGAGIAPDGSAKLAQDGVSADSLFVPEPPRGLAIGAQRLRVLGALFGRNATPETLGRYVLLGTLGKGGMGTVLRAFDRELDRQVALKVLHEDPGEQPTMRLRREAQALAKLSHPNVVQVYEVGEAQGQTFVVMELVKGQTLADWMRQEPRPHWRACVEVYLQAGAGLVAAHEYGLVHRDFKPGNAIIDDKGRVRVLDFGLARYADENPSEDLSRSSTEYADTASRTHAALEASLTATGSVLGTPAYMPPEQMRGKEADARSDQFSFCVSLWEALYGQRPFDGSSMAALMLSIRNGPIRPSSSGGRIPAPLHTLLLRGLAPDPQERWPSMEALLEQLRRRVAPQRRWVVLAGTVGLLAVGGGLGSTRALEWLHRCTGARAQLEGVWDEARTQQVEHAILGTGLSYAPETWERVKPRLDAYATAWAAEHTDACEATRSRGEQSEEAMGLRMACLHQRRVYLRATVGELEQADATVVENAVQAVANLPGLSRCQDLEALRAEVPPPEDPAVAEQVAALDEVLAEAKAKQEAGKYEQGLRLADEVVNEGAALDYEPLMARAWLRQGDLRTEVGDHAEAVEVYRTAYRASLAHTMLTEAAEASTQMMLVLSYSLSRHEDARSWARDAEPLSRAAGSETVRAGYLNQRGVMATSQGEYAVARDLHEQALAIRRKALGPKHPSVAASLNNLGNVADSQGEDQDARDFHERALAIRRETLGPKHPHVAHSLNNLGNLAHSQGEFEDARDFHERALAIRREALGPKHHRVANSLNNLGVVAHSQGAYDNARDFHQQALAIRREALGPKHPHVAHSLNNLGNVARAQGKYGDARDFHEHALAIRRETLGPKHPDVADSLNNLGTAAKAQGEHESARDYYSRALAILEAALSPQHPDVGVTLNNLGGVTYSQGAYDDARDFHERALAIWHKTFGPEHPNVAYSLNNLGGVAYSQGDYDKARDFSRASPRHLAQGVGPGAPQCRVLARKPRRRGAGRRQVRTSPRLSPASPGRQERGVGPRAPRSRALADQPRRDAPAAGRAR